MLAYPFLRANYPHSALLCRDTLFSPNHSPIVTVVMMRLKVDGADLSRSRKLELQDQLRNYISSVLQALESVLAPAESEGMVGSAGRTAVAQKDVILAALDCLREWAKLGVSIGRLASDRPRLLDRIVRMLGGENGSTAGSAAGAGAGGRLGARANGDEAAAVLPTACAAGDVIMELMAVQEYPRPPARNAAAEAILNAIGKMSALFAAAIQVCSWCCEGSSRAIQPFQNGVQGLTYEVHSSSYSSRYYGRGVPRELGVGSLLEYISGWMGYPIGLKDLCATFHSSFHIHSWYSYSMFRWSFRL